MSSSTWRVLSGYATYHRTPMRMIFGGKWAPLKLIAIIALPLCAPSITVRDHSTNRLKCNFATKPAPVVIGQIIQERVASLCDAPGQAALASLMDGFAFQREDGLAHRFGVRTFARCRVEGVGQPAAKRLIGEA